MKVGEQLEEGYTFQLGLFGVAMSPRSAGHRLRQA